MTEVVTHTGPLGPIIGRYSRPSSPKTQNVRSVVAPDLGEDAGGGGHSAVHHAVEDGEQAVQRERLGPQEVVAGLSRRGRVLHWRGLNQPSAQLLLPLPFPFSSGSWLS